MNKKFLHFLSLFCLAAIFSLFALSNSKAQVISGDLVGTVLDKSGSAVPAASIEAVNVATGVKYTTTANAAGEYRFTNLPVGAYNVSASAANFATTTVSAFQVELNKTVTLPITLEVKGVANTIEVSGAAQPLDTTTAQVTNDFSSLQVENLPSATAGSGVLNLSLLDAGVATSGGVGVGTGPSVGGQRPRNNNFTIEGVDNNNTSVTGPLVTVPNDAVSEFSVLQNQFSPEFGHSSGGQFNTIVKSGTNEFHGLLYEYNQNRNYDALDTLQKAAQLTSVPRFDDNRFGGNLGGPILKNKLFFFGDYEYEPIGQVGVPVAVCAPSAAGLSTINSYPGLSSTNVAQFEKYVPVGTVSQSQSGCRNLPWPNPNGGAAIQVETLGLSFLAPSYTNSRRLVTSMDYDFSSKDQLRGRYLYDNTGGIDTAATLPVFFTSTPVKNHLVAINEYHTFNPGLLNELRLGFNRFTNNFPAGNFSYPGLDSFPNLLFSDLGQLQVGPDPNAPQYGASNTYQLADSLTWTKSTHTFTFGIEGRKLIAPSSFTQRSRGDYEYRNVLSFFQDQVPNLVAERSGGNSIYEGNRSSLYWFANDNWRLRSNFTVNLGVRYEYTTIPYSETLQSLNSIASVPGLVTFAAPKAPTNDWEPRIGFAYSPGNSGRTSIRAGFSLAYDVLFDNLGLLTLPPELSVTQDCGKTLTCPAPFLASGGIPPGKGGITTYPNQAAAALHTSADLPVNTKYPKSMNWSLGVEHSFGKNYTLEVRYVGTRGLFLPVQTRLNAASQVTSSVFLPTYTTAPSQVTLNALPFDLNGISNGAYGNGDGLVPAWENAGFFGAYVTSYQPWGASTYHGLATQLNKHMAHGLQLVGSYTFSHAIDNSTAEVFSTVLAPRRPENFDNFAAERSNSILDHRHRATLALVYDMPFFKNRNWFTRNTLGNWELAPIYTFQSGQWVTAQSGIDSNLNGDSAPDRTIWNASGIPGTGSGVIPLCNSTVSTCPVSVSDAAANPSGVVAYLAMNPNAQYIQAGYGASANVGRNTLQLPPINDVDLTAGKTISLTERMKLSFQAQAFNVFNHAQWVGGYINDVAPIGYKGSQRNMLEPDNAHFNRPQDVFSSNPRTLQLALKFSF